LIDCTSLLLLGSHASKSMIASYRIILYNEGRGV